MQTANICQYYQFGFEIDQLLTLVKNHIKLSSNKQQPVYQFDDFFQYSTTVMPLSLISIESQQKQSG
jgi:hypothetical protein